MIGTARAPSYAAAAGRTTPKLHVHVGSTRLAGYIHLYTYRKIYIRQNICGRQSQRSTQKRDCHAGIGTCVRLQHLHARPVCTCTQARRTSFDCAAGAVSRTERQVSCFVWTVAFLLTCTCGTAGTCAQRNRTACVTGLRQQTAASYALSPTTLLCAFTHDP